jgi:HEPN domain-containing protein
MNDNTAYWIELAEYDIDTAKAMLETKRYLYVGFMCHQVIEKMLKAYWSDNLSEPPVKIHTLSRLAERCGLYQQLTEDQLLLIDALEPLNIEARYPSYKERLLKSLSNEACNSLINRTDDLRLWIKQKLSD